MSKLFLALDLGTTAIKAAVVTPTGQILSLSYLELPLFSPMPGYAEQDARLWWTLTSKAVEEVLRNLCYQEGKRSSVCAVSLSAQGISIVPVDAKGQPLYHALTWLDIRATEQADWLGTVISRSEAFRRLGIPISPAFSLPKILWLRKHELQVFKATHKFLTAQDFVIGHLIGTYITDHSVGGGTLLHNLHELCWDQEMLSLTGISEDVLPLLSWAGTPLGTLRSEIADEWGLQRNTVVVLGGHDQKVAALGTGMTSEDIAISLGTASVLVAPAETPIFDAHLRIPCYPSVEQNTWVLEAPVSTGGASLRWLRETIRQLLNWVSREGQSLDYDQLTTIAESVPPGSHGVAFYPHLSGATAPHWIPGAFGAFTGLTLASTPADLVRSVIEGWAYQLRNNLEVIESLVKPRKRVIVFGGGARNKMLTQLIANVLNRPVWTAATTETALVGAALLAATGSGFYGSLTEAKSVVAPQERADPQPRIAEEYKTLYSSYCRNQEYLLLAGAKAL